MRNDVWQRRSEIPCMADGVHQPFYTQSPQFTTVMSDSTAATSRLTLNLPTINLTNDMQQVRDFQENYVNFMEWSNTGEDMVTGNAIARNVVLQNGLSNKSKKKRFVFLSKFVLQIFLQPSYPLFYITCFPPSQFSF